MNPPILANPDMSRNFIVTTDASDFGLGYKLSKKLIEKNMSSNTLDVHLDLLRLIMVSVKEKDYQIFCKCIYTFPLLSV